MNPTVPRATPPPASAGLPRLGFLGVGWIGRHRMAAVAASGSAVIAAIADPRKAAVREAAQLAPGALLGEGLEDLLRLPLDGIVIATPSAAHAEQALAALERGLPVFCQKPLARTRDETRRVVAAARNADRLLEVDLSYRRVRGIPEVREAIRAGEIGELYAMDLTFHNAYGPGQPWFYDIRQAGGGCLMDLGTHLVDLALWMAGFPDIAAIDGRLWSRGKRLAKPVAEVEDHALADIEFGTGAAARIACSWGLSAGRDAVIEFVFHGTRGAFGLRNVEGSFYDFVVEAFRGPRRDLIAGYPDPWGGRAILDWAGRLGRDRGFDPEAERLALVAAVLDEVYGR
jgi:predicted dehydrogenase